MQSMHFMLSIHFWHRDKYWADRAFGSIFELLRFALLSVNIAGFVQ